MRPLVTVVTPTLANRHAKLLRACRSVQNQTLREWTHLIVPNGYDGALEAELRSIGHLGSRVRVVPLGRPHGTPGHWNRLLAGLLVETPYVAYLDDDNWYRPRHLEVLVGALERSPKAGFAYGQAAYVDHVLGADGLAAGGAINHVDASMVVHRVELLERVASWDPHLAPEGLRYALDGFLVDRWLTEGVTCTFVPEITLEYPQVGYAIDGGGAAT